MLWSRGKRVWSIPVLLAMVVAGMWWVSSPNVVSPAGSERGAEARARNQDENGDVRTSPDRRAFAGENRSLPPLPEDGAAIEVHVHDKENGRALRDALIRVPAVGHVGETPVGPSWTAVTDDRGVCIVHGLPRHTPLRLFVVKAGFRAASKRLDLAGRETLTFHLQQNPVWKIRAVDHDSQVGLAGVDVRSPLDSNAGVTGPDGICELRLRGGQWVRLKTPGYVPVAIQLRPDLPNTRVATIQLSRGITLVGTLLPKPREWKLGWSGRGHDGVGHDDSIALATDSAGRFRADDVPRDAIVVCTFSSDRIAPFDVVVDTHTETGVIDIGTHGAEVVADLRVAIRNRLRNSPVVAEIEPLLPRCNLPIRRGAKRRNVVVDGDSVVFHGTQPGRFVLRLAQTGRISPDVIVTVRPPLTRTEVTLEPAGTIAGRVVVEGPLPRGYWVTAEKCANEQQPLFHRASAAIAGDGRFEITDLQDCQYDLQVIGPRKPGLEWLLDPTPTRAAATPGAGDVVIAQPPSGKLRVRILGASSGEREEIEVWVTGDRSRNRQSKKLGSSEHLSFSLRLDETYSVRVRCSNDSRSRLSELLRRVPVERGVLPGREIRFDLEKYRRR